MPENLRPYAFLAAAPALYGAWLLVDGDFNAAMAWLLIPAIAAGVVLSLRFFPLSFSETNTATMNSGWKRGFIDIGFLALGYLGALIVSAVVTQFVDDDLSAFPVALLLALVAGGAALLGVLGSFLILLPIATLVQTAAGLVSGNRVDPQNTAGATLLLAVSGFATALVFATNVDTGGSSRGEAWTAIFVLLTGLESEDARIVSQPLAWVARLALLLIVGSVVWLGVLSKRRKQLRAR